MTRSLFCSGASARSNRTPETLQSKTAPEPASRSDAASLQRRSGGATLPEDLLRSDGWRDLDFLPSRIEADPNARLGTWMSAVQRTIETPGHPALDASATIRE